MKNEIQHLDFGIFFACLQRKESELVLGKFGVRFRRKIPLR
jgi:hypothetical protein